MRSDPNRQNLARRDGGRSLPIIVAGVFLQFVALYFTYAVLWSAIRQMQAGSFSPVAATVLSSSIQQTSTRSGGGPSRSVFAPDIRYAYTVDGVTYESARFNFFGPGWKDSAAAKAAAARFPVGAAVTANHDPHDHSVAVLDTAPHPPHIALIFLVLAMNGGALLVLLAGWRRRKPRRSPDVDAATGDVPKRP